MRAVLAGPPHAIAHRGSRLLWPENTMQAFQGAYDMGFRWFETDIRVSADGVLVCIHDETLDRTTGSSGPVVGRSAKELAGIDATARFSSRLAAGQDQSEGIPLFEEAVDALPLTRWVVDLKVRGVERPLAELVFRRGWEDRIIVGGFGDDRLRLFRRLTGGAVATSTGVFETLRMWSSAIVGGTPRLRPDAVQVPVSYRGLRVVTQRSVAAFTQTGAQVHVWTVNDAEEMRKLLRWGVQGIITDRPDIARSVFEELGLWSDRKG